MRQSTEIRPLLYCVSTLDHNVLKEKEQELGTFHI